MNLKKKTLKKINVQKLQRQPSYSSHRDKDSFENLTYTETKKRKCLIRRY